VSTAMSLTQEYPAAPAEVYALFTHSDFLQARMEAGGGIDPKVVSIAGTDGAAGAENTADPAGDLAAGATIVTQQAIPASVLPSMVASMMAGDPVTERTETWRADGEGYVADFSIVVKGAPASLKGTMRLAPSASGSTLTVEGTANVPIPMFGPKLENVIAEQITTVLGTEGEYTRSRLGA